MSESRSYRILLVDDELSIVEIFGSYLRFAGYEVVTAIDGEEALEKVRTERPDLMILDIGMPKMDGWQVCEKIKGDPKTCGLPVIFFTAFDQFSDRERARKLCVQGFIAKPCEPTALLEEIRRCLLPG